MKIFDVVKNFEKLYDNFLTKITGSINAENYNILHPCFLAYYFGNKHNAELSVHAYGTLLDIGCGIKPYYKIFEKRVNNYFGIDYPDSVNIEQQKTISDNERRPDLWGDAIFLPLKSCSIDTVFSSMVLEHIAEPDLFLKEVYRVLRKDGVLIFSTAQSYPIHHEKYDFFRYTSHGLRYLLEKNALELQIIVQNGKFFAHTIEMINLYINRKMFRNVKGDTLKIIFGLLKVVFTPVLLVVTLLLNISALILDKIDIDETFTTGYCMLARKK